MALEENWLPAVITRVDVRLQQLFEERHQRLERRRRFDDAARIERVASNPQDAQLLALEGSPVQNQVDHDDGLGRDSLDRAD